MIEFVSLAAAAGRYIVSLWRAVLERRAMNALLHMDERLLRDIIGLIRVDVVDSFTPRMGSFELLMARRDERRAGRRSFHLDHPAVGVLRPSKEPPASLAA